MLDCRCRHGPPSTDGRVGARSPNRRTGATLSRAPSHVISGRTVVITGAASGIGRALARRLSSHGCPVALADVNEEALKETEAGLAGPTLIRVLDVRDAAAQQDFADEVSAWAPEP